MKLIRKVLCLLGLHPGASVTHKLEDRMVFHGRSAHGLWVYTHVCLKCGGEWETHHANREYDWEQKNA